MFLEVLGVLVATLSVGTPSSKSSASSAYKGDTQPITVSVNAETAVLLQSAASWNSLGDPRESS